MKKKALGKLQISWLILGAGILLLLPLRTVQFFTILEPGTGFFASRNATIPILYVLLAVVALAGYVLSFLQRKTMAVDVTPGKRLPEGVGAAIFAVTLLWSATSNILHISEQVNGYLPYTATGEVQTLYQYMVKTGCMWHILSGLFAVASAVYMLADAYYNFKGKGSVRQNRLLAIAPLFWCIFRTIQRFTRTISYLRVSDLFLELLMLAALMLFFLAMAQTFSGINDEGKAFKLPGYGIPAAMLCLLCFVPRGIVFILGKGNLLATQSPAELCDLGAAIFIITVIMGRMGTKDATPATAE